MIALKILIHIVAIATLTGQITASDDSPASVQRSNEHIKALGAAQIGPSFRKKRDEDGRKQEEDTDEKTRDMEETNLLEDAEKNVQATAEELKKILTMHIEDVSEHRSEENTGTPQVKDQGDKVEGVEADSRFAQQKHSEVSGNKMKENEITAQENESLDEQSNSELNSHNETQTFMSSTTEEATDTEKDVTTAKENSPEEENISTQETTALPSLPFDTFSSSKLNKIMIESTEVAEELQNVFKILAEREAILMKEVIRLKDALTGAVAVVSSKSKSGTAEAIRHCRTKIRRNSRSLEDPYKACVYIESSNTDHSSKLSHAEQLSSNATEEEEIYPPEPSVRVYFPNDESSNELEDEEHHEAVETDSKSAQEGRQSSNEQEELEEHHKTSINHSSHTVPSSSGDDIDLSKVYWLKLPTRDGNNEAVMEHKVEEVISEVKEDGKDALIIPVSRGLNPQKGMTEGFVKSVRPKPALQKKLRRHIRRSLMNPKQHPQHRHSKH